MHLELTRSGGLAGLRRTAVVDDSVLPPDDVRTLRALVDQASVFDLPATIRSTGSRADRFQFHLTIDDGERRHTVDVDDGAVPALLRPLIDWLMERSAPGSS